MNQSLDNKKFRLRVTYKKTGVLAYVSHLELIKSLEACIRRSGLPYCVSQGYSPHMKISFGPALAVGIESEKQIFDIYLKRYIKPNEALCALKEASKNSLEITDCKYIDNSEPSASANFGTIEYFALINKNIKEIKVPKQIEVEKKKKVKIFEVSKYLCGDIKVCKEGNFTKLNFCLNTYKTGSLKPYDFLNSVLEHSGCSECKIINFKII